MGLLEAMSCEVPTVSSNVDGIPEVVQHGETGYTAPPDDHQQLANYIIKICSSDELARELGKQGRRRAIQHFNKDLMVEKYINCYKDVLDQSQ